MSFFKSLKRNLGFSSDDDDEEDTLYADTTPDAGSGSEPIHAETQPATQPVQFDPDMRTRIFDKVIEVFNASLPDFLAKSVDTKAQREYLLAALDSDTRAYLDALVQSAEAACRHQWEERQASLSAELEAVRRKSADIEKQSAETKQKQLSADRQKRALADRVHDLESTLGRLEAEREQYELENRSLVNRLKVATVQQDDIESGRTEIENLRRELNHLRENPTEASAREIERLKAQVAEMTDGIESLKGQQRVANEMLADQRERTAAAEAALREREAELAETHRKLVEANSLLDGFNEVSQKLAEIDRVLSSRDAKIRQQKKLLTSREAEIESLRQTISENLRLQAEREKALRDEIGILRGEARPYAPTHGGQPAGAETAADDPAPIISESDLSDIEKTFESEEWFTKTPPPETPSMRSPEAEAEFGYHPPKRRSSPANNPDQLSLF